MKWLKRGGLAAAIAFLAATLFNASWLTAPPRGYPQLLARGGVMQQPSRAGPSADACTAAAIEVPVHSYLENTLPGLLKADGLGAHTVAIDIAPTADGKLALFRDASLDCRTDGRGEVRLATMAQLKALDAGYGYTADGGKTFPLRGQGIGYVPTLESALAALPRVPLLYNLTGKTPGEAALVIAALRAAGRDVTRIGDAFSVTDAQLPAIRAAFPGVWVYSAQSIAACTRAYLASGWLGITPAACQGGTIAVPLNYQWAFAGWPNRLIARMAKAGAHVIVTGPYRSGVPPRGIDLPEQLGQIPATFNGTIWVEDIWAIGPALHPAVDRRNAREKAETAAGLELRRKARKQ